MMPEFWFTNHDLVGFRRYLNSCFLFVAQCSHFQVPPPRIEDLYARPPTILIWPLKGSSRIFPWNRFPWIFQWIWYLSFMNFSFNNVDPVLKYWYAQRIGQGLVVWCLTQIGMRAISARLQETFFWYRNLQSVTGSVKQKAEGHGSP